MNEWGIKHYQPHWTNSTDELTDLLLQASLIGEQIESVWILWDNEYKEWFEDAPVFICTKTRQLELCAYQLDYFSFSVNSIDLSSLVYWCGTEEDGIKPMSWVLADNSEIQSILGKKITEVGIIQCSMDKELREFLNISDNWLLSGVSFCMEDKWLRVLNGLDCNRLEYETNLESSQKYILASRSSSGNL